MLDAKIMPYIKPLLHPIIKQVDSFNISPNQVTVVGFLIGMMAVPFIICGWWKSALLCIIFNRVFDGIDGELARYQQSSTSAGGFLDICLDFLFYASVPLAFGLANPAEWGAPAMVLLAAFIGTGSSFLAFAIAAEKFNIDRPQFANKSFYYMHGLTEGTETIILFLAFCLWPQHFTVMAYCFAAACAITIITRVVGGFLTLKRVES
jgi:phosphatidylglycerophosphate synthase